MCAALAPGTSGLEGALFADDTRAMLGSLLSLGLNVFADPTGRTVTVLGCGGDLPAGPADLDVRLSGTTCRFLLPMLCLGTGPYRLDGGDSLRRRPLKELVTKLVELGASIDGDSLPLTVEGGGLTGGSITVQGAVSSQFLSGLLLAAPYSTAGLTIQVAGDLVSKPYVDLTMETMSAFGVDVVTDGDHRRFDVSPKPYQATTIAIEPDASAASYFFAAAAITGGRVRVEGLGHNTTQGDLGFVKLLERMGAVVTIGANATEVTGTGVLHGIEVDMSNISDTAQTLAVVATFAESPTVISGIGFIRRKETDRIHAVITELRRVGIRAEEHADGLVVYPGHADPATIQTYDDHRMAMSFALFGLRYAGIEIADPECVNKTFPEYFDVLDSLAD